MEGAGLEKVRVVSTISTTLPEGTKRVGDSYLLPNGTVIKINDLLKHNGRDGVDSEPHYIVTYKSSTGKYMTQDAYFKKFDNHEWQGTNSNGESLGKILKSNSKEKDKRESIDLADDEALVHIQPLPYPISIVLDQESNI